VALLVRAILEQQPQLLRKPDSLYRSRTRAQGRITDCGVRLEEDGDAFVVR
jgi:hypothetical protein